MTDRRSTMMAAQLADRAKRAGEMLLYLLTRGPSLTAALVADLPTRCGGSMRAVMSTQKYLKAQEWIEGEDTESHLKVWTLTESGRAEAETYKAQKGRRAA